MRLTETMAGRGRVLLRKSGTEPLVRVMVEGDDEAQVRAHAEALARIVAEAVPKRPAAPIKSMCLIRLPVLKLLGNICAHFDRRGAACVDHW